MPDYEEQMMMSRAQVLLRVLGTTLAMALLPSVAMGGHDDAPPTCLDEHSKVLEYNNEVVVRWVKSTPNQYKSRAHINGTVVKIYAMQSDHHHISVQIGNNVTEVIEVIYNEAFGKIVREVEVGSTVQACGDYITSKAPHGPYRASPDGAILHWVHRSTKSSHHHGYLMIDGILYGDNKPAY
jgi:hypothetical protein